MTHDELLAKIDEEIKCAKIQELCGNGGWSAGAIALRAVVKLHKPENDEFKGLVCWYCTDLNYSFEGLDSQDTSYPCPTIQAIEKELE